MKRSDFLKLMTLGACGVALDSTGVSARVSDDTGNPELEREIPQISREFRGVWVATVENIDWPTARGLSPEQQKAELLSVFDLAQSLSFNAIIFQVRPSADAIYPSRFEPWSEYLTGKMGVSPGYDPLQFAIDEAHRRGMELHAWFNPFRALHPSRRSAAASDHVSVTRPDFTKTYGRYAWLDPGHPDARVHSCNVILDVVERYDIDGVHFDDYFYPYKERLSNGYIIQFPDDDTFAKFGKGKTAVARDLWRRSNIDAFLMSVSEGIKRIKPNLKFGISPFGIWQPGFPKGIVGMNSYAELYSDSRKWISEGWVDYLAPQLYWPIQQERQSYVKLLDWWLSQNKRGRHVWPGSAAYKVADGSPRAIAADEIARQVAFGREANRNGGNILFSFKAFRRNRGGLADLIRDDVYAQPALVPASPWLDSSVPPPPKLQIGRDPVSGMMTAQWESRGKSLPARWVVCFKRGDVWELQTSSCQACRTNISERVSAIAVWAVSRTGVEGRKAIAQIGAS